MSDPQMKTESDQDKGESEKSNTPEALQIASIKDPKPKGDVMDVFKQFATTTGPSWADMMVEEQLEKELKELELRAEEVEKSIKNIKEPYIVHLTNLYQEVTAEDLFYFFGGNEAITDLYPFGDPHQALVEFNTRDALKNALMKNGVEFFKKKLVIKVIDHNKLLQIDARQVPEQHRQNQSNAPQYSRDRDRQDRDRDRERQDRQGRNNKGRSDRGQSNRQYDNRSYNNRSYENRPPRHQQSNDVRYSQHIPSLLGNPNDGRDYREDSGMPAQTFEAPRPPVEFQPTKPKPSPFGDAKPTDKVYENMQKQLDRIQIEKEQDQIKSNEQKRLQKKTSISSQHSQFTNDESIADDQKQAKSVESKSNEVSESEKKPYSSNTGRNRKILQHSRSDFTGHSRTNHKINVQHVKKLLGMQPKNLDSVKEDERKYRKSSDGGFVGHERKYGKNRFERKNSSTGSHSNVAKNGSKEILKQSSVDKKSPPPSTPISHAPPSSSNSSVEDTAVSTPTNADPSTSNPLSAETPSSATKPKKSKSNKKKKNSTTTLGSGMFGALEEVRD